MRIEVDTMTTQNKFARPYALKKLNLNPSEKKLNGRSESVQELYKSANNNKHTFNG